MEDIISAENKDLSLEQVAEQLDNPDLETLIQNITSDLKEHAKLVGGPKDATDILSSRFMPAQKAYDEGILSCGTMANIPAEMLRKLGYKVKLVHGRIPQTPTHAWITVQDKKNEAEWHPYDLTRKLSHVTPEHKPEYIVESWEEIRPFLENWHNRLKQAGRKENDL